MSWGYVAVAAGTVIAGAVSSNGAKKGAAAAQHGADAATAETARQYDQTRNDFAPWRSAGANALDTLSSLYGWAPASQAAGREAALQPVHHGDADLPQGTSTINRGHGRYDVMYQGGVIGQLTPGGKSGHFTPAQGVNVGQLLSDQQTQAHASQQTGAPQGGTGQPNMNAFFASPDYQFRRDEGNRGIEGSFAARGMGQSGNALRALTEFNSNLASGEFGNYFNRLAGIAGIGQTATNQTAAYGADAASQAGRNSLYAGNARASGIQGQADAWGNTAQGLAGLYGYYKQPGGSAMSRPGLSTPGYGSGGGWGTGVNNYPGMG
jgi:hypothetical protein